MTVGTTYVLRDPFAGDYEIMAETLDEAIAMAYEDIPTEERPAYVWYQGVQVSVPGGLARPVQ